MQFIDRVKIYIESGAGGNGCLSFRRARNVPRGGPDGGNGGRGGSVIAECVEGLNTLIDYRYKQHFKSKRGHNGEGSNKTGADSEDIILFVPIGTQIINSDDNSLIADLTNAGEKVILAEGGRGGIGNASFKSSTNRAPRRTEPGESGISANLVLQLKLLADVGLVGLPNAGKSTLLSVSSRARPKISDYPFTTLSPQLGVVEIDDKEFVIADLPGLIQGAHKGTGLGGQFLGHVERCNIILHLIDCTAENVAESYQTIRDELSAYGHGVNKKIELVCLAKVDALDHLNLQKKSDELASITGQRPILISSATGKGVKTLLRNVSDLLLKEDEGVTDTVNMTYDPLVRPA